MMQRHYYFAGIGFTIEMPEQLFYQDPRHLGTFAADTVTDPHRFTFQSVVSPTPPEGGPMFQKNGLAVYAVDGGQVRYMGSGDHHIRATHLGKEHHVQVPKNKFYTTIGTNTVLECLALEHLIAREQGFLFHCSYIALDGQAILFTAPSETGKSTQAELWHTLRGAEIINGDRAAVRWVDGRPVAEGIPFCGSSTYCKNRSLPIRAIVYLGQAPQTSIRRLKGYEAFSRIWEGISVNTWDREDVDAVSLTVQNVVGSIPIFHLPCTPDESAVIALEQALRKQEKA